VKNCCRLLAAGLWLAIGAGLSGCVTNAVDDAGLTRMERAELQRREERLQASPRRVSDARLDAYLQRLLAGLEPQVEPLRIHVLDRPEPQADLLGGQVLLLRTGLLAQLHDEDELVFVLAHELAHRSLAHVAARRRTGWDARSAELAADRVALQTSQRAGYRASAGAGLLGRLLGSTRDPDARRLIQARIDALPRVAAAAASIDPEFEAATAHYRTSVRAGSAD
jgi:hypothetical protein